MRPLASISIALLLLSACTSTDKPDKRRPKSSSATKPSTPAPSASPNPPARRDEPVSTPMPTPMASEWWCICYQAETEAGPRETTSCRELESECRELEKRVGKGGRGIVAGSLSTSCRAVNGEHPGDALGGREAWLPSKRAGAWTSEGSCLLGPVPLDAGGESGGESGVVADEPAANPAFTLANERFGDLHLGMTAVEVQDLLGAPDSKGAIEEEGASGEFIQDWAFRDAGLSLTMSADTRRGAQSLRAIRATAPSNLQTKRGIGIGSSYAAVDKAYGDVHDQEGLDPGDKSSFTAGSIFGGVFFDFEAGKVREIFIGAEAE